jgi:hypothetical protein
MTARLPSIRLSPPGAALALALVLPVFAWAALTYPGYFELHSGFLPVFNLNDLLARSFDLSWTPDIGGPRGLLRTDGPLPYWLAAVVRLMGSSPSVAIKFIFGLSLVVASLGMFAWARRALGAWPALVAAAVYTFSPVVLATVYVRGAFAEAVFVAIVPWVLFMADSAVKRRWIGQASMALSVAAALLAQPGLGLWLAIMVLGYLLVGRSCRRTTSLFSWALGVLFGLAALAPALLRSGWSKPSHIVTAEHLIYPHQLLGTWGTGPSIPGPLDALTFNLGFLAFGLATIGVVLSPVHEPAGKTGSDSDVSGSAISGPEPGGESSSGALPAGLFLVLLFLTSTMATPVWRLAPFASDSLTYPWQLLLLALPWLSWLAGMGAKHVLALGADPAVSGVVPLTAAMLALVLLPSYGDLRPTTTRIAVGSAPLALYGDNEIALLSADFEGAPRPGGQVTVEVRWQALRSLDRDYTVFFHVMGADEQRYGQQDTTPGAGSLPTSAWWPGQIITDRYMITIATSAPAGIYEYWLGFYDGESGERLSTGSDDKYVMPVEGAGG